MKAKSDDSTTSRQFRPRRTSGAATTATPIRPAPSMNGAPNLLMVATQAINGTAMSETRSRPCLTSAR